jgi:hypothetical protein
LCEYNVRALVGKGIQCGIDVQMNRGINQWPSITLDESVVSFTIQKEANLLHVGDPIDLGI